MLTQPPLALYVHIPWCLSKCPYCDFNSYPITEIVPEAKLIPALLQDLALGITMLPGRVLSSIFIGGGTPSIISAPWIEALLSGISNYCQLATNAEITLEANPGTVHLDQLIGYRQSGINRLSLGIQSFNAEHLRSIGRIHSSQHAIAAVHMAQTAGFEHLNLDLMFGLPKQDIKSALYDLEQAVNLAPTHISWYQLTLEPNTRFFTAPPELPDEDVLWEIQNSGQQFLDDSGFAQYEVSAYAQNHNYCVHNLNYWQFGDYLGIGPGAHSKLTASSGQISRIHKPILPEAYFQQLAAGAVYASTQILDSQQLVEEFLLNALRLRQGFSWDLFEQRTGLKPSVIMPGVLKAQAAGLIDWDHKQVCTTNLGYQFLNQLLIMLFM
ncbi:hypothetical protein TI04_02580 [Achromatium sp. WMS2]|nr:hypothetical protein TI04_02580 [Achromatium sp. WMS2]